MNNKIFPILAILLIIGSAFFLWPSNERKISSNLKLLADACSSEKQEPVIKTLQKTTLAAKLCTDPCTVQMESLNIDRKFAQKELTDRFLMMKKRLPDTRFSFHDTEIKVLADNRAEIITTLRLNGKSAEGEFTDAYEMNISAEKNDGDWLFASFVVVEFMKK